MPDLPPPRPPFKSADDLEQQILVELKQVVEDHAAKTDAVVRAARKVAAMSKVLADGMSIVHTTELQALRAALDELGPSSPPTEPTEPI